MAYGTKGIKRRAGAMAAPAAKRSRYGKGRSAYIKPNLAKQVRQLVSGSQNVAVTQNLSIPDFYALNSHFSCNLFSNQAPGAPSSSVTTTDTQGVIVAPGREKVHIKGVRQRGSITLYAQNVSLNLGCTVRRLTVWFYKVPDPATTTGVLPQLADVLEADGAATAMESLPLAKPKNAGAFTIIDDKRWYIGAANLSTTATQAFAATSGPCRVDFDDYIKVDKDCSFAADCNGTAAGTSGVGGHYDSDVAQGQVTRGLLMQYWICDGGGGSAAALAMVGNSRLTYMA